MEVALGDFPWGDSGGFYRKVTFFGRKEGFRSEKHKSPGATSLGATPASFGRKVGKVAGIGVFSPETRKSPEATCPGATMWAIS